MFPQRPPGPLRRVYFAESLNEAALVQLKERGYEAVCLITMPRDNDIQEREYLRAKLQGVEEGTVQVSEEQLVALREALKLAFPKGSMTLEIAPGKGEGVLAALGWASSRFTLRGNTTLVAPALLQPVAPDSGGGDV